jgi:hypothetical protein
MDGILVRKPLRKRSLRRPELATDDKGSKLKGWKVDGTDPGTRPLAGFGKLCSIFELCLERARQSATPTDNRQTTSKWNDLYADILENSSIIAPIRLI